MIVIKRSKEAAGTMSYDEASADIEQMLIGRKQQSLQSDFLQELKGKASIEILDQSLFNNPEADEIGDAPEAASDDAIEPVELPKPASIEPENPE
jgi:hypothetical protein